eukprot:jgi/Botrbrau1/580/Bobra.0010s0046.1
MLPSDEGGRRTSGPLTTEAAIDDKGSELPRNQAAARGDFEALLQKRADNPDLTPMPVSLKGLDLRRKASTDLSDSTGVGQKTEGGLPTRAGTGAAAHGVETLDVLEGGIHAGDGAFPAAAPSREAADTSLELADVDGNSDSGGSFETARDTAFSPTLSTASAVSAVWAEAREEFSGPDAFSREAEDDAVRSRNAVPLQSWPGGSEPATSALQGPAAPADSREGATMNGSSAGSKGASSSPAGVLSAGGEATVAAGSALSLGKEKETQFPRGDGPDSNPGPTGEAALASSARQPETASSSSCSPRLNDAQRRGVTNLSPSTHDGVSDAEKTSGATQTDGPSPDEAKDAVYGDESVQIASFSALSLSGEQAEDVQTPQVVRPPELGTRGPGEDTKTQVPGQKDAQTPGGVATEESGADSTVRDLERDTTCSGRGPEKEGLGGDPVGLQTAVPSGSVKGDGSVSYVPHGTQGGGDDDIPRLPSETAWPRGDSGLPRQQSGSALVPADGPPSDTDEGLFSPYDGSTAVPSSTVSGTPGASGRASPTVPAEGGLGVPEELGSSQQSPGSVPLSEAILRTARDIAAVEQELRSVRSGRLRDGDVPAVHSAGQSGVPPQERLLPQGHAASEGAGPDRVPGRISGTGVQEASGTAALGDAEALTIVGDNENSLTWRSQRKHIFVLSNAGKPVFTLHGDDNALAGFMAIIDAIISFVKDKGDTLQHVRAGKHLFVFVQKGPLYLLAVSATGEPPSVLERQLDLVHAQIVCILTNHFDRMLAKNPRFDSRRLLGGTQEVLRSLIQSFEWDPSALMGGFLTLPLPSSLRHTALVALQAAVKAGGALYGVLLAGDGVVALTHPRAHPMHVLDVLLLSSFVKGTSSFRQAGTESFSPVCLPQFNASAFLHAYVRFLDLEAGLVLILLSPKPDDFYVLSSAAARLEKDLQAHAVIRGVVQAVVGKEGRGLLRIQDLPPVAGGGPVGETALLHFVYKAPPRFQIIMPAYTAPLDDPVLQQAVMPAYATVRAMLFREEGTSVAGQVPGRVHFRRNDRLTTLAYVGPEYEIYAQYDALVDKETATGICNRLATWIKQHQADLFVPW